VRAVGRALAAGAALAALAAGPAPAGPRLDYVLHCQGCHRADGSGTPDAVPRLRGRMARFLWAPGGRAYLVGVPGAAQSPLDDARLATLLNWMLAEFDATGVPPGFAPYTAAEVGRLRVPLADVETARAALLQAAAAESGD
jgi:hypothetical protein